MATKTLYEITAPDGTKLRRNSTNPNYACAIVFKYDGTWRVFGFRSDRVKANSEAETRNASPLTTGTYIVINV